MDNSLEEMLDQLNVSQLSQSDKNKLFVFFYLLFKNRQKRRRRRFRKMMRMMQMNFFQLLLMYHSQRNSQRARKITRSDETWIVLRNDASSEDFEELFRMTREDFFRLEAVLKAELEPKPNFLSTQEPIPTEKQVAIAMYLLGTGRSYTNAQNVFGVAPCTANNILYRVINVIIKKLLKEEIVMPEEEECGWISQDFKNYCGIPHLIGCLGSVHIPVIVPESVGKDYMNTFHWTSLILQVVMDFKGRIRAVSTEFPGSFSEAAILMESELFKDSESFIPNTWEESADGLKFPYNIVGNLSYPHLPWLVRDYTERSPDYSAFNERLSVARKKIDEGFTRLKSRFPVLVTGSNLNYEFMPKVLIAYCILHNFLLQSDQPSHWTVPEDEELINDQPPPDIFEDSPQDESLQIRETLRKAIKEQ